MHATCWDVEAVAFADVDLIEVILDASISNLLGVIARLDFLTETCNELAATVCVNDVPHFVLTHLPMPFCAEGIIGVNLNGEVLTGIDELDEEGEVVSELLEVLLTEEVGTIARYDFRQSQAFVYAVCGNGF